MNGWAGTRAEREWLAALRRIADSLEAIAVELRREPAGHPTLDPARAVSTALQRDKDQGREEEDEWEPREGGDDLPPSDPPPRTSDYSGRPYGRMEDREADPEEEPS